jgi:hypothetical protein
MKTLAALLFCFLAGCASTDHVAPESFVLGQWCSGSESTTYESFELSLEANTRVFRSWLHARPESTGTWTFDGRELSISGGPTYRVLSLSPAKMELQYQGGAQEIYLRQGCREITSPGVAPNNSFKPKPLRGSA